MLFYIIKQSWKKNMSFIISTCSVEFPFLESFKFSSDYMENHYFSHCIRNCQSCFCQFFCIYLLRQH